MHARRKHVTAFEWFLWLVWKTAWITGAAKTGRALRRTWRRSLSPWLMSTLERIERTAPCLCAGTELRRDSGASWLSRALQAAGVCKWVGGCSPPMLTTAPKTRLRVADRIHRGALRVHLTIEALFTGSVGRLRRRIPYLVIGVLLLGDLLVLAVR
jgi:hypothetical protein